jgi:hypothetical protein
MTDPTPVDVQPTPDPTPTAAPVDPRIGQRVGPPDSTVTAIGFDDGGEYEVSGGVITTRVV